MNYTDPSGYVSAETFLLNIEAGLRNLPSASAIGGFTVKALLAVFVLLKCVQLECWEWPGDAMDAVQELFRGEAEDEVDLEQLGTETWSLAEEMVDLISQTLSQSRTAEEDQQQEDNDCYDNRTGLSWKKQITITAANPTDVLRQNHQNLQILYPEVYNSKDFYSIQTSIDKHDVECIATGLMQGYYVPTISTGFEIHPTGEVTMMYGNHRFFASVLTGISTFSYRTTRLNYKTSFGVHIRNMVWAR